MVFALCGCSDTLYKMADSLDEFLSELEGDSIPSNVQTPKPVIPADNKDTGNGEQAMDKEEPSGDESLSGKGNIVDNSGRFLASDLDNLIVVSDPDLKEMNSISEGRYYYDILSDTEKKLYCEMLFILRGMHQDIKVTTLDEASIDRIFTILLDDRPELFFVQGYTFTRYTVDDELRAITFSGTYSMSSEKKSAYEGQIAQQANTFLASFAGMYPNGADDYHTIKYIYEYIIENTEYVAGAPENQNIISSMINHQSVCAGYAREFQYLTNMLGYKCAFVEGFVKDGDNHAWNLIMADGYYYYVDPTFGDPSYASEYSSKLPSVNYDYLLVNAEMIKNSHTLRSPELIAECIAMEDNYYIKEGTYFVSVDPDTIKQVFNNAYENQNEYLMMKMSDSSVYNEMWRYLIEDQNVFKYLRNQMNSISYLENPDSNYMIFWLY